MGRPGTGKYGTVLVGNPNCCTSRSRAQRSSLWVRRAAAEGNEVGDVYDGHYVQLVHEECEFELDAVYFIPAASEAHGVCECDV